MSPRRKISVKVDAWVDEEVAPLVLALSCFEGVVTVASSAGTGGAEAYVRFRFEGSSREGAVFASDLGGRLRAAAVAYRLAAEWADGEREPLLCLSCPTDRIEELTAALAADSIRPVPGEPGQSSGSRPSES
jgi:hypothetical protein